jgi:GTP-binding protein
MLATSVRIEGMSRKKLPIVAIVGRANVGKSSLFNAILQRREAIVADEPGTTRDSIMAKASYMNSDFWIVDTAGIKDPEDDFEFTIQEQVTQAAESADVIWVVIEANIALTEEDRRVSKLALKTKKPVFLIVNKHDKANRATADAFQGLGIKPILLTSATQNYGIDELLDGLMTIIPKLEQPEDDNRLHIALLGRPNVGKSYLFNTLAKKQQAIVADRAGTTRDINRAIVRYKGREVEIMDTAGIRRSGKINVGVERFSVIRSLSAIEQSDVVFVLMDVNELGTGLDQKIAGMVKEAGKGLVLVVSKWDALDEKTPYSRDQLAAPLRHEFAFVPWAPLVFTSSVTGQNVTQLFELATQIDERRQIHIRTPEINRWLREVVNSHPPAGLKNTNPKLNYIVQEDDQPLPSFKVFGSQTKLLHWSYKRYMERNLREKYDLTGTAIKFWFIEKEPQTRYLKRSGK